MILTIKYKSLPVKNENGDALKDYGMPIFHKNEQYNCH